MFWPCRPCCCQPCGDCTCSVQIQIEYPGFFEGGNGVNSAFSDGLLYFTKGPDGNGAYMTGTVTLTCECGTWYVTIDICYGEDASDSNTETWEFATPAVEDFGWCPDDVNIEPALIGGGSSPIEISGTISCQ